jgi:hypothetical protein
MNIQKKLTGTNIKTKKYITYTSQDVERERQRERGPYRWLNHDADHMQVHTKGKTVSLRIVLCNVPSNFLILPTITYR